VIRKTGESQEITQREAAARATRTNRPGFKREKKVRVELLVVGKSPSEKD